MAFDQVVVHYLAAGKERRVALERNGNIRVVLFDRPPGVRPQETPPKGVKVLDGSGKRVPTTVLMSEPGPGACYVDKNGVLHCW
jgi:hypothetical protein